jgi:hypothetical protein
MTFAQTDCVGVGGGGHVKRREVGGVPCPALLSSGAEFKLFSVAVREAQIRAARAARNELTVRYICYKNAVQKCIARQFILHLAFNDNLLMRIYCLVIPFNSYMFRIRLWKCAVLRAVTLLPQPFFHLLTVTAPPSSMLTAD